jgi:hypothetical protein
VDSGTHNDPTFYSPRVAAGNYHSVGLRSDGTAVATGNNQYGQCAVASWRDITQVSAGDEFTIGLKSDGTVIAIGDNFFHPCEVTGWTDITQITAGAYHSVGLKADGTVLFAGPNGERHIDVSSWRDITQVSAGANHILGLRSDGTVVATGLNNDGQCNVDAWTGIIQVTAGWNYSVGLKSNGTVAGTGLNPDGQYNVTAWTNITQLAAGAQHIVGLKSDGTIVATGRNAEGQCDVTDWSEITQVSAGAFHTLGLKSDGTVVAVGPDDVGYCDVTTWNLKPAATATSLTSSANPSVSGQAVAFNATVTAEPNTNGKPTGTVTFWDGTQLLETEALNTSGQSTYSTVNLPARAHSIFATYGGDVDFAASASATLAQNIWQCGDANLDGFVDMKDITKVERVISGADTSTGSCDVNRDGIVNRDDITAIERIIQGLDQVVYISDPLLADAVRQAIDKPVGDIYQSDLLTLTELHLGDIPVVQPVKSLAGLEYCTNLTSLNLHAIGISDISPLASLHNLSFS